MITMRCLDMINDIYNSSELYLKKMLLYPDFRGFSRDSLFVVKTFSQD